VKHAWVEMVLACFVKRQVIAWTKFRDYEVEDVWPRGRQRKPIEIVLKKTVTLDKWTRKMLWTLVNGWNLLTTLDSSHNDKMNEYCFWFARPHWSCVSHKGPLNGCFVVVCFVEKLQHVYVCVIFSGIKEKNFFLHYEVETVTLCAFNC